MSCDALGALVLRVRVEDVVVSHRVVLTPCRCQLVDELGGHNGVECLFIYITFR